MSGQADFTPACSILLAINRKLCKIEFNRIIRKRTGVYAMQKLTGGMKLYEQVLKQIENLIIQGVYKKGELLPGELHLAEEMGVSRITIREALRLLNEAGVIETVHGKGSYVRLSGMELLHSDDSHMDFLQKFLESTEIRLMVEPILAKEAAIHATDEEIDRLGQFLADERAEETFHRELIATLHKPILLRWLDELFQMETDTSLQQLKPPVRQKTHSQCIREQHEKIYEALRERDGEFAYFYMKQHLLYMKKTYKEFYDLFYGKLKES